MIGQSQLFLGILFFLAHVYGAFRRGEVVETGQFRLQERSSRAQRSRSGVGVQYEGEIRKYTRMGYLTERVFELGHDVH